MIYSKPIFIASPPRTGTTLIAALLAIHGYWIGRSRETNYPGTNMSFGSENLDIKEFMKKRAQKLNYRNWNVPLPEDGIQLNKLMENKIKTFLPENELWLIKTSWLLIFYKFWIKAFPEANWVFPIRSEFGILDSMNRHPSMKRRSRDKKAAWIEALFERQRIIKKTVPKNHTLEISSFKIAVKKHRPEIKKLLSFAGINKIKWDEVNKCIKPEMFHMM